MLDNFIDFFFFFVYFIYSALILYLFPSVNFELCSFSSFFRCKVRLCAWAFSCVWGEPGVWGLASPLWGLRAMVHEQGAQVTCSSAKNNCTFVILSNYGSPVLGCGFVLIRLYLRLLLILMLFFTPFLVETVPLFFIISEEIILYLVVDFLCPWEELSSESSSFIISNPWAISLLLNA